MSGYVDDGRPFLEALYRHLEADRMVQTVTFSEYLEGSAAGEVAPHPIGEHQRVHDLFTGSWIDEPGSRPGVDLGTWIGEPEENLAWVMLLCVRRDLAARGVTPESTPEAFRALYAAEGSDWFWWLGDDQPSGSDAEFETLFRGHLSAVYRSLGLPPPEFLRRHIVSHPVLWTFPAPAREIQPGTTSWCVPTVRGCCSGRSATDTGRRRRCSGWSRELRASAGTSSGSGLSRPDPASCGSGSGAAKRAAMATDPAAAPIGLSCASGRWPAPAAPAKRDGLAQRHPAARGRRLEGEQAVAPSAAFTERIPGRLRLARSDKLRNLQETEVEMHA